MDINALMKQAQEMQKKMKSMQDELGEKEFEGTAGAGMVKFIATGNGLAKRIEIDDSLMKLDEKDILEDLIIAAFNDAKKKVDEESSGLLNSATSGMNLPKGFDFNSGS